jgi:hypothetical protein
MFDFFKNCIVSACGNYFKIIVNVSLNQQLMYNVHTYNHVICLHFHHQLWDIFATSFQL